LRNIKAVVEYDGTDYFGFQLQPRVPTIQKELEWALGKIAGHSVRIIGSGRTDAGVHAAGQVVNFRTEGTIPTDRICIAMNSLLPGAIVVLSAEEVDESFHARYSAKSRLYRYDILNRDTPSALMSRYCVHVRDELNVDAMIEAGRCLIGVHDFASFASADGEEESTVRNLTQFEVRRSGEHLILDFRANAFLRSMVRTIVGTLLEVGRGRRDAEEMRSILDARDRRVAGKTAPPHGLCLMEVEY
jgi:tRNA pseudouridine38-40 synthase